MKQLLAEHSIRLTKSLGQNFLHDANQLRRIVAAAELKQTDRVLEVGPGLGPLTDLLVEQAAEVLAIEKDAKLVEVLEERFKVGRASVPASPVFQSGLGSRGRSPSQSSGQECPRSMPCVLHLLHDDALEYLKREAQDWSGWKLVANLPYSVASPILVELAMGGRASARAQTSPEDRIREDACPPEQAGRGPQRMVATLQIEVAKRLLAKAGTPDYGVLTLLVQMDYEPHGWFRIPASCFFPEPDVDSACVCLIRREPPLLLPEQRDPFIRIVKRGFSQRRKMMFKLLKEDWPELRLSGEFEHLGLSRQVRAEEVSLEQFTRLAQSLAASAP